MRETLTDNGFPPLSSLRLIVPPLQLVSAALLEIVKQGAVMYFGLLEEFITTVLETAPELLTDTERLQLVIGLRAKVVLEMCRDDASADQQALQLHLSKLKTYITNQDEKTSSSDIKASVTNFLKLVKSLMGDYCQRKNFYQNIFPSEFGPKYDSALQALMKKFLLSLQKLLPAPSFEQTSLCLSVSPSITKECIDFMNQTLPLKTLIQHHKHRGSKVQQAMSPTCDDSILSSLSYHLPNEDINKDDAPADLEPVSDPQDEETDDSMSGEPMQMKEEIVEVLCTGSARNVGEHGQQAADDHADDHGASVEVTLPSFEETESNDNEDQTGYNRYKPGRKSSAKKFRCHICGKDFATFRKLKKHKMSHSDSPTKKTSQRDSTSHRIPFQTREIAHYQANVSSPPDSEPSNDDCSLVCLDCGRVYAYQKNFDKHQKICAARRERQLQSDLQGSTSSASDVKSDPGDEIDTSNGVLQKLLALDQTCERKSPIRQCSICWEIFTSSNDLSRHMQCHSESSFYLCSCCGQDFSSYEDCKKHEHDVCGVSDPQTKDSSASSENKGNQDTSSKKCQTAISSVPKEDSKPAVPPKPFIPRKIRQILIPSVATASSKPCKPILMCPECGKRFADFNGFDEHKKKCWEAVYQNEEETSTNYIIIDGCDPSSVGNAYKRRRKIATTPSGADHEGGTQNKAHIYKCTMCEESFLKTDLLEKHYTETHDVREPYSCALCKITFLTLYDLLRHQQNLKLLLCPVCKKGFRQLRDLKKHEKLHGEKVPYACEICGRSFSYRTNLVRHQKRHRYQPPVGCSYCGKKFRTKDSLRRHMVIHTSSYPCPVCGKKFYKKTYLKYHLYKHTGQEPYLCDTCGKGWPTPSQLKIHMVQHREDRPLKCKDCDYTCKWESSLISHRKSRHSNLRPFACKICGKAFRINSHLRKHMMVHSGERPFSCLLCHKTFKKRVHLKKHREKPCLKVKPVSESA